MFFKMGVSLEASAGDQLKDLAGDTTGLSLRGNINVFWPWNQNRFSRALRRLYPFDVHQTFLLCVHFRTMKAGVGVVSALALFLLLDVASTQRPRPKKPTRRPATTRRPSFIQPAAPEQPEPAEPTDFPPVILGPPSMYPDCPRECLCSPSYPNSLNCENRNIRVVPQIPSRAHYLYLQNNFITEVTEEAFNNATDVRWINLSNNRIHKINKQVRETPHSAFRFYFLCLS